MLTASSSSRLRGQTINRRSEDAGESSGQTKEAREKERQRESERKRESENSDEKYANDDFGKTKRALVVALLVCILYEYHIYVFWLSSFGIWLL